MRIFKSLTLFASIIALVVGGLPAPAQAATGPVFDWISPQPGAFVSGVVTVEGIAQPLAGSYIKQWCFKTNGVALAVDAANGVAGATFDNLLNHNFDGNGGGAVFDSATGCYNASTSIDSGTLAIDTTAWPDDTYTFEMTVTDSLNRSFTSNPLSVITMNAAPTFAWLSPASGSLHSGVVTFEATASPDPDGTAFIKKWCLTQDGVAVDSDVARGVAGVSLPNYLDSDLVGSHAKATFDSLTGCYSSSDSISSGSFAIDTTTWQEGLHNFVVVVTDSSNRTVSSATLTLAIANHAPKFEWVSPVDGSSHVSAVSFSGLAATDPGSTATVKKWCLLVDGLPSGGNLQLRGSGVGASFDLATGCFSRNTSLVAGSFILDFADLLASSESSGVRTSRTLQMRVVDSSGRESNSGVLTVSAFLGELSFAVSNNSLIGAVAYAPNPQVVFGGSTASSVSLAWNPPPVGQPAATGYVVNFSTDAGHSWQALTVTEPLVSINGLSSSTAVLVRVAAKNGLSVGAFGSVAVANTTGTHSQKLFVVDSEGNPVSGGALSYRFGSSNFGAPLGLSAAGSLTFSQAPAGSADLKIVGAKLADGVYVSATTKVVFGSGDLTLRLPPHSVAVHSVAVTVAGSNDPVTGATVVINKSLRRKEASGDFVFEVRWAGNPNSFDSYNVSGLTDSTGVYSAQGFLGGLGSDTVRVSYVDSGVARDQTVDFYAGPNSVELPAAPRVVAAQKVYLGSLGKAVNITLSVVGRDSATPVKVSLIAPAGAKTKACPVRGQSALLTGMTGSDGKVHLRVCATANSTYRFKADGALASGWFDLRVNGAKPSPVQALNLTSGVPGALAAAWSAPSFLGGARLSYYLVSLKPKAGGKVLVKKVTSRSVLFSGLAHATDYTVSVVAVTKYGSSAATVAVGGVA